MTKTIFTLTAMTAFIVSRSLRQDHLKVFLRVLLYVCRELVCVIFPFWISNLTSSMNGWIIWSIVIVGLVNWFFIYFDQTSNYLGIFVCVILLTFWGTWRSLRMTTSCDVSLERLLCCHIGMLLFLPSCLLKRGQKLGHLGKLTSLKPSFLIFEVYVIIPSVS